MLRPPISCPLSRHVFSHNLLLFVLLAGHVHVIILVKICECKYCRPHSQCNVHILCTFAFRLTAKFIWPSYFSCSRFCFYFVCNIFFVFLGGGVSHTTRTATITALTTTTLLLRITVIYSQFKQKTFNYILSHAQKRAGMKFHMQICWQHLRPKWANLIANKFQSKTQRKVKIFA